MLSLPADPTQEKPISVTQFVDSQEDAEESQSILQVRQGDQEILRPVSTIGEIFERDVQEAGPSGSGLPYTVISEGRMDRGVKLFLCWKPNKKSQHNKRRICYP